MSLVLKPIWPLGHRNRTLDCEDALLPAFEEVTRRQPGRQWTGQEPEFNFLRAEAAMAGWLPDEIDQALRHLARTQPGPFARVLVLMALLLLFALIWALCMYVLWRRADLLGKAADGRWAEVSDGHSISLER